MPEISLTTFTDFILKSGFTKITCVKNAKKQYQKGYDPSQDFWRTLRIAIVKMHQGNQSKSMLDQTLLNLKDKKKQTLYPKRVQEYKRWLGRKNIEWFHPPNAIWQHGDIHVRVNPEIGLIINGSHYAIKLYFKDDKLSQNRVDTILFMLKNTLNLDNIGSNAGIMDIPRGRLITPTREIDNIEALLIGEASSFLEIWNRL